MIVVHERCQNPECIVCATRLAMGLCSIAAGGPIEVDGVERLVVALRLMPADAIDALESACDTSVAALREVIAAVRLFRENDTQPIDTNDKGGN